MKPERSVPAGVLLVLLAVLPLVPSLAFILRSPWPESSAEDDLAILEIRTIEAGRGRQVVGPYSRFGWSHPGPAEFYLLLPAYLLSGRKTAGLGLGAVVLNMASAAGLAFTAVRVLGVRRGAPAVALLAGLESFLGPSILGSAWNPHIAILPFALFLFLAAAFAVEGLSYLPAAAFVGSCVVQTHLGYLPVIGAVSAAALWERSRSVSFASDSPRTRRPLALTAALLLVLWIPPVVEQLKGSPGNLTQIARFFSRHGASHTFAEIAGAVVGPLGAVPMQLAKLVIPSTSDERFLGAGFLSLLLVALLPAARASASRRGDAEGRALSTVAIVSFVVALWSVLKIRDEIHDYLVLWLAAVGLAGWTALVVTGLGRENESLPKRSSKWARPVGVALAAAIGLLATVSNARKIPAQAPVATTPIEGVRDLTGEVRAWLAKNRIERPVFAIGTHDTWVPAAGLFLNLHKAGISFAVEEEWWPMFGRAFRPSGREGVQLVLGDGVLGAALAPRPDYELVGRGGGTAAYALKDPHWLERHVRRGRGRVLATAKTRGDPSVVADGQVPDDGTAWDAPGNLVFEARDSFVTLAVPDGPVVGVLVSADNNDSYAVEVSRDGAVFEEIGVLPESAKPGMRERPLFSARLRGARALRILPRDGDGAWSVGEVSFVLAD